MDVRDSDAFGVYEHSFGHLANNTTYQEGYQGFGLKDQTIFDMRPELKRAVDVGRKAILQKALTTSTGTGTTDDVLVPVFVDPRIVDLSRKYTPFVEIIPRVTNLGTIAAFNRITAKGAAVFAAEDASLTEANDTKTRASQTIKYLYSVGRVTGPAQAAVPSYILAGFQATGSGLSGTAFAPASAPTAMQQEVLIKARAIREAEEDAIWNADSTTTSTEFNGIVQQQSTTNQTDKATTAMDYDDLEDTYQLAWDDGGRPNISGASSSVLVDLRKIMIDTFRYRPMDMTTTLPFGVSSHMVIETMGGPVPVIPSQNLSNTSGAKQLFFLDMSIIEMRVLLDMTFEDLAKTNDSRKFMLKIYECLILRAPQFNSFIDNIL